MIIEMGYLFNRKGSTLPVELVEKIDDVKDYAVDSPWIKENFLPAPYKVCTAGGYLCVTSSDYINDGDVYLYDTDGMLVYSFPSGLNPVKAIVVE